MNKEELKSMCECGDSLAAISSKTGKGKTTIRYWLKKLGLKTQNNLYNKRYDGIPETKHCTRCDTEKSSEEFYRRRDGTDISSYCKPCSISQTVERQQKFKRLAVEYKGGSCKHCGYNRYLGTLEFHHLDPTQKDFSLAHARLTTFGDKVKKELDKCILLCSNCHREQHAREKGLIDF